MNIVFNTNTNEKIITVSEDDIAGFHGEFLELKQIESEFINYKNELYCWAWTKNGHVIYAREE